MSRKMQVIFADMNIADTRWLDLYLAMSRLHTAMAEMDDTNNRRFINAIDGYDSFADFMNAYASQDEALRANF